MLKFTGTGSAFNPELGNVNAYIKEKESLLLIDCGGTVFERLLKSSILNNIKNLYILITHTHPDHIGSLGDIIFYSYYALSIKATVIFPDEKHLTGLLECMGVDRGIYNFESVGRYGLNDKNLGRYDIGFYPASHVDAIPCYGIEIKTESASLYFSGDSNDISSYVRQGLENGKIDRLYQDTCGADYEGNYHLSLRKLAEMIEPGLRHKVYCMHMDKYFNCRDAISMGFNIVEITRQEGL